MSRYAGITSPYLNRGGLQQKFERSGERITAEQRSVKRKQEERWGAAELHRLERLEILKEEISCYFSYI